MIFRSNITSVRRPQPNRKRFQSLLWIFTCSLLFALTGLANCKSVPIKPPTFDYELLAQRYLQSNRNEHFPLTVQRGSNHSPSLSVIHSDDVTQIKNRMFYTTNRNGSRDIWLRDLDSTVNIPVIEHPAEQYDPAVTADGAKLAYVTEDRDPRGDIRVVPVSPDELIQHILEGGAAVNLWDEQTLDLSREIEKQFKDGNVLCRGRARESAPVWHPSGKYLLFVSDRCTPGRENLWKAEQQGIKLVVSPLTVDGAVQPTFSGDGRRIAFVSYRREDRRGEIYLREESSGRTKRIELPRGPEKNPFIYLYPALSANGQILHYVSIREDTNGNGYLDPDDNGAIYKVNLRDGKELERKQDGRETQLVENSSRLSSLTRGFLEESILYSAERAGAVNIYLILKGGVVPRQKDIDHQYRLSARYRDTGLRRYFLSLNAVRFYFGETLEFLVYEGRVLRDQLKALPADDTTRRKTIRGRLDRAASRNEYARLERELFRKPGDIRPARALLRRLDSRRPCDKRCRLFKSATLELLARNRARAGDRKTALALIRRLNREDPDFFRKDRTGKLQGDLELAINGRVPAVFGRLVKSGDTDVEIKESILADLFSFYYNNRSPADVRRMVTPPLARTDLAGPIRAALLLARARSRYDVRAYLPAREDAREALKHIDAKTGLYVQAYQLIAQIEERRGDFDAAFNARRQYAEVKTASAGARLDPDEYREILQEFERRIDVFLRDARALAAVVEERERGDFDKPDEVQILVGGLRERIVEFCKKDSYSFSVYRRLGPKFLQRYNDFCGELGPYQAGKTDELTLAQIMTATEIFYQAATADANLLNIVFFNLRRAGLFDDLYDRYAVYYHRRKVEIVLERNRHQVEWQKNRFRILKNLEGFVQDEDPFDEGAFNEILNGYGTALPFARDFGDLSMIYGASYALIQRSLERERLYDSILEEGALPTDASLMKKKEAILRDLKTADYHLQYILYVDPAHVDAYLLRGWLYEYLEYRRGLPLKRQPTFYTRALNFVTFTTAPAVAEGDFYADSFDSYFPDRLYEENVELYRQALDRLRVRGDRSPDKRASLHLNLGNNYFHLLNFGRALEHYQKVLDLGGTRIFTGYRQQAIFHYNRGRSLFYEGRSRPAAEEFKKAYDLYETFERKPLHSQYSDLIFALQGSRDSSSANWRRRQKLLRQEIDGVRTKMALLAALMGLSRWEAGQHDEAIRAYRDARRRLYGEAAAIDTDEESKPGEKSEKEKKAKRKHQRHAGAQSDLGRVDDTALLNFIALAFQNKRDLRASDLHAKRAAEIAREEGLSRDDYRYRPGSIGGRLLGCFINYGEDFSVIGEGRTPYGFAPLRQFHLALGIQLENMILRGDLEGARKLLKERREVFEKRDGDVQLGQIGTVNSLNQEAFTRYLAGDFSTAGKLFLQAAEHARDVGDLGLFERNFYNHFHAVFTRFERAPPPAEQALKRIARAREEIEEFRESYRERAKASYIEQKKIENPNFEYREEEDDRALAERVAREIVEAEAISATLDFYAGHFQEESADDVADMQQAFRDYSSAAERFDRSLRTMRAQFGVNSLPVFRVRINRSQALAAGGRLLEARKELEDLAEKSFEFNLGREDWEVRWRLGRVLDRIQKRYASDDPRGSTLRKQIIQQIEAGLKSAAADRPDPPAPDGPIEAFYDFAAQSFLQAGQPARALAILEGQWERYLQQEYARYPLSFDDPAFNALFQKYRSLRGQSFSLARAEQLLRLKRQNIKSVQKQRLELNGQIKATRASLLNARPTHRPFLRSATKIQPRLAPGQVLLRLFLYDDTLAVWKFKASSTDFQFLRVPVNADPAAAVRSAFDRALKNERGAPILIVDHRLYGLPLEEILRATVPGLPALTFAARVTADHRPLPVDFPRASRPPSTEDSAAPVFFAYNVHRVARERDDFADADIIVAPVPGESSGVFTVTRESFPFREWLARGRHTSAVLFSDDSDEKARATVSSRRAYRRRAAAFEVLRAAGAGTMAEGSPDVINRTILARARGPYAREGLRVFGAPGVRPDQGRSDRIRMGNRALGLARQAEARKDFYASARLYGLSDSLFGSRDRSGPRFEARIGDLRSRLRQSNQAARDAAALLATEEESVLEKINALQTVIKNTVTFQDEPREVDARRVAEMIDNTVPALEGDYPGRKNKIRGTVAEALYLSGRPESARAFLKKYPVAFIRTKSPVLEFLTRLREPRYGDEGDDDDNSARANFAGELRAARPFLRKRANNIAFLEDFLRHSRHRDARQIMDEMRFTGEQQAERRRWMVAIALDGFLLHPRHFPRPAYQDGMPGKLHSFLAPLHDRSTVQGDTQARAGAGRKFRQALVRAYNRQARGQGLLDLSDLANAALGGGRTSYSSLSRLERVALFRLLAGSLKDRPRGDTAGRLKSLIEIEARYGRERAAWMNLEATRAYLEAEEPAAALGFFRDYIKQESDSIQDRRRLAQGASLGLALLSAGVAEDQQARRAELEQTLIGAGRGNLVELYRRLPEKVSPESVRAFANHALQKLNTRSNRITRSNVLLTIKLLKHRARQAGKWPEFFNLAIWDERLQHRRDDSRRAYRDVAGQLRRAIPAGQAFIALVDAGGALVRLRLESRGLAAEELPYSSFELRRQISRYLQEALSATGTGQVDAKLARLYRSFLSGGQGQLTYYWASGLHSLAPVNLERGDRIFQILDPNRFVNAKARKLGGEFKPAFRVRVLRAAANTTGRRGIMENIAIGQLGDGPPYHRVAYAKGQLPTATRGGGAWFFVPGPVSLRRGLSIPLLKRRQARIQSALETEFAGPGIYTVHPARGQAHAFFLKFYYSRALPLRSLHERLLNAYFHQRRRYDDEYHLYGYHLVTTCPLTE